MILSGTRLEGLSSAARWRHVSNPRDGMAFCNFIVQTTGNRLNLRFPFAFSCSHPGCCLEGFCSSHKRPNVPGCTAGSIGPHHSLVATPSVSKYIPQPTCKHFWRVVNGVVMRAVGREKGGVIESSTLQTDGEQTVSTPDLLPVSTAAKGFKISFCPRCGGTTEEKIPVGEHEVRYVCTACRAVHYQNPKMVVGCVIEYGNQILLCRRNIEPGYGLWTLPAGYMEIGESAAEGAARESLEEACAIVEVISLYAHLDLPFIGQSYIIFRAKLKDPHFAPGPESLECALFKLDDIPFDMLAFSSIHLALKLYTEDVKSGEFKVHHGVIEKKLGASPSDLAYTVRDLLST